MINDNIIDKIYYLKPKLIYFKKSFYIIQIIILLILILIFNNLIYPLISLLLLNILFHYYLPNISGINAIISLYLNYEKCEVLIYIYNSIMVQNMYLLYQKRILEKKKLLN